MKQYNAAFKIYYRWQISNNCNVCGDIYVRFGHSARVMISSIHYFIYPLAMRHGTAHKFEYVNRMTNLYVYTTFLLYHNKPIWRGWHISRANYTADPSDITWKFGCNDAPYWIKTGYKKIFIWSNVFILHVVHCDDYYYA